MEYFVNTERNILIVDDDMGFRKTLSDILRVKGYSAVAVDNGQSALDEIKTSKPIVALIDLKLEDISGLELLKEIKTDSAEVECILLTGHATQKSAIEAVNLGAYGYIQKPYDVEQLLLMIRNAIEIRDAGDALRAYATRLQTLREIDQDILEARSSKAIAQAAMYHIRHLVPCEHASVVTFDFDTQESTILAIQVTGESQLKSDTRLPLTAFTLPTKLKQGDVLLIEDISTISNPTHFANILQSEGIIAYASVPLISQGELVGNFNLGATHTNIFSPEHIEIALEVAGQLAVAIQQARLNEQIRHHANELEQRVAELQLAQTSEREQRELAETLREVTGVLSSSLNREQVLRVILEQLARVVDYDGASVMLVSTNNTLDIVAYRRTDNNKYIPIEPLLVDTLPHVQELISQRVPVIIPDTTKDKRWLSLPGTEYIQCWLGVPLVVQNRVIGMLNVNKKQFDFYTSFDAEIAKALADQAAIAVDNAQLFEQAQQEIIERKRAEEALAEERARLAQRVKERTAELSSANMELARAARLKDEFLAAMSHELRTPLNAVLGLSEALQEEVYGTLNNKQHKSLHTIEESGRHLLSLINDILDVSKIEAGKLTLDIGSVSVEALCQACLRLVKQAAQKKNIKISSSYDSNVASIQADQRRLKQIIVNLLSNAVKFTPKDHEIGLTVSGHLAHQQVHIIVWDTGIGISKEGLKNLFTPFIQLDSSLARQHTGTGLGLTLVSRLTEMHGGDVSVESKPGQGSRFTVSLPWKEFTIDEVAEPIHISNEADVSLVNAHHALIVEDTPAAADQISRYLKELNIKSVIHPQGTGAVDKIVETQPDVVILDIMLPDISGWEILQALKKDERVQNIPVLIASVVDEPVLGVSLDAADYLVKPISRGQLQESLNKILPSGVQNQNNMVDVSDVPDVSSTIPQKSPLILLAEDNENNIATISGYLKNKGYRITIARDGNQAVTEASHQAPDLILMDIQMPGMDGLEATQRIRTNNKLSTVPIIALTALTMPGDKERCLAAGANDYMSKPVSLKRLVKTIERHLGS